MQDAVTPLSESEAVDLVKDVFASATERDIYTVCFLESIVCFSLPVIFAAVLTLKKNNATGRQGGDCSHQQSWDEA